MPVVNPYPVLLAVFTSLLGSPHWPVRESAHRHLAAAGESVRPLLHDCLTSGDPEVRRRCLLLASVTDRVWAVRQAALLVPRGWKHHPWLTFEGQGEPLSEEDRELRYWCLRKSMNRFPSSPPSWEAYREATGLYFTERIRAGALPASLRPAAEDMRQGERDWIREHGRPYGLAVPP